MTKEFKADVSLLFATVLWGATFPIICVALKSMGAYTFLMFRFLISAFFLFFLCYKNIRNINKKTIIGGTVIGLTMFLGSAFQTTGLLYTTASKSGFITGLNVVIVPIILAIAYMRRPDNNTIIGAVLSLIGLGFISLKGDMSLGYGDILTLIGTLAFSFQIIAVDKYANDVDPLLITLVECIVTGSLSMIPAVAIEKFNFSISFAGILALLFCSIFATVIAYGIQNKMQPFINPAHASIIYLAEPVFCAIFSVFIGDILTVKTLIGCLIIFLGMLITNIRDIFGSKDVIEI